MLLNDSDPLWMKFRHMHIAELLTTIHAEYKEFLEKHKESAALGKAGQDVKTMAEGLRGMPKFQEQTARYSLHIHVGGELVAKCAAQLPCNSPRNSARNSLTPHPSTLRYNQCALEAISMLEQNMAIGEETNGKAFRTALQDLRALLQRQDVTMTPEDRIRLVLLFIITQEGVQPKERKELMELAGIQPEDQVAILNLGRLGVNLLKGSSAASKRTKAGRSKDAPQSYDVSRHVPALKRLLVEGAAHSLSTDDYPYVAPPPGAAASAARAAAAADAGGGLMKDVKIGLGSLGIGKKGGGGGSSDSQPQQAGGTIGGQRLIVFVLGGLSYSELRTLTEVQEATPSRDLLLGGTAMLTPRQFLIDLKDLKQLQVSGV